MYERLFRAMIFGLLAYTSTASAHGLWISANVPYASHGAQHVVVLLGFGHSHPIDDLLELPGDLLQLRYYDLIDPRGQRQSFEVPDLSYAAPVQTAGGLMVQSGDLGVRKLSPTPASVPGTYQLVTASKPFVVTRYKDRNGAMQSVPRTLDQIPDAAEILYSVEFQSAAKAYYHHKQSSPAARRRARARNRPTRRCEQCPRRRPH